MPCAVLRRVLQKRATEFCRSAAGVFISPTCRFFGRPQISANLCCFSKLGAHRMMSSINSDKSPPPRISPWLVVQPPFEGGDTVYKFYSLAEKESLSFNKRIHGGEESESPDEDAELVGSSHGWIALFNRRNNDLFLSNPLSGRHIKLPPIDNLPDHEMNLRNRHGSVSKVILSSSPEDERCRAVMTFGPGNRLAFCSPRRSSCRWIPIGKPFFDYMVYNPTYRCARVYEDLVYRKRRNVLTCMTSCEFDVVRFGYRDSNFTSELENWDISDDDDADVLGMKVRLDHERDIGEKTRRWSEENKALLQQQCVQIPHLVYDEQLDRLYLVMRFVLLMGPDNTPLDRLPHCPIKGLRDCYPCQTFGFVVVELDDCRAYPVVDDLNGLAMFLGMNHSFAISASDLGELKPNSIYFTDAKRIPLMDGRHDTGVFDYQNKTISPIITADHPVHSDSSIKFFTLLATS
ncbi:hypothetical protein C2S52_017887 [Perilla frutescens var. hirtella]|nr:hypothetical protein C2S52_017887 [Perilla frutescens var. hirtella]